MDMILVIGVVVIAAVAYFVWNKNKSFDVNQDGKVDAADLKAAVQEVKAEAVAVADVNKDGVVDAKDAEVVVKKAKAATKKAATKAKETAKKATPRKPRQPKAQQ